MTPEYEAEIIPGLEPFAIDEIRGRFPSQVRRLNHSRAGFLRFSYGGQPARLHSLRSVIALYRIHSFEIPRPKALLGHQHFTRLLKILAGAAQLFPRRPRTLGIGAAGSRSSVMSRLHEELAAALRLESTSDKGDLFLRILPNRDKQCWEALARTTLQPLSKRDYRLKDMPGSLNATVAYAMTQVKPLGEKAAVVNLCSGSSTILIEHALQRSHDRLLAIDKDPAMIMAGRRNSAASAISPGIDHLRADAAKTPLPPALADRIYADLPFGNLVGSHDENRLLYPAVLQEAARLARPQSAFVVLTHEIALMRKSLRQSPWRAISETRINLRGLRPCLFVLERNSARI
ncbi:MAG: RNA methyltransferase [Chloroflexota bacterium]|nr:RNA methyltransferase [Chloroflexota bacterium]